LVIVSRALGIFPAIPHNDVALQAAVNFYFHSGNGRIPAQTMLDTLGRYGDYAGLAAHYTLLRWVLDRYPVRDA
jgi:3-methyladenine DNA glycosylase/8-oxoguanine DNA glycosylase